jgi:hypothetical protein
MPQHEAPEPLRRQMTHENAAKLVSMRAGLALLARWNACCKRRMGAVRSDCHGGPAMQSAMRMLALVTVLSSLVLAAPCARADDTLSNPTRSEREPPSMLSYAFTGLGTGALVGLSGGYLAARDANWDWGKREYRAIGLGASIGALSGIALGLGLGAADLGADAPGYGGVVLRDTLYGTGLGAVAGLLAGGISAFARSDAEHALFGTAIGAVAGAGVGMIIGFIEAPRAVRERKKEEQPRTVTPAVSATRDARNELVWVLGSAGRF